MTVKQISVFLENKSGMLKNVLAIIKDASVQLIATTIADTTEYGIFRIICDKPQLAYDALKKAGIAVTLADVFAIELDDKPGTAADVISSFADDGMAISYLYSFILDGKGILIFKTDKPEETARLIKEKNFQTRSL